MRIFSILIAILIAITAYGQNRVVKEAESAMNKGEQYAKVLNMISPAFEDPQTSGQALTFFIPGKAGMNTFKQMVKLEQAGQLPKDGEKTRADALLGGYKYLMQALSLDSVSNGKGKIKTKYSGEIVKLVADRQKDFNNTAISLYINGDWQRAYEAWDIFCKLPFDPRFAKIVEKPDSAFLSEVMYNRSLAAYKSGDMPKALASFLEAKAMGYNTKVLYDYLLDAADKVGDADMVDSLCAEAFDAYGDQDYSYIRRLINRALDQKDYQVALDRVNAALAIEPNNAQYYLIRGVLYEELDTDASPLDEYKKAVELDPQNGDALFNLGRTIYNIAVSYNDNAPTALSEYAKYKAEKVVPKFKEAIVWLEKAWEANNANRDILVLLEQAYYNVSDADNMKYTQERMKH